ncbi:MAG TPA: hypothetical protein VES19_15695 [Candidatus Limnocylindrales bacterium]|nr:hypothetical protein [Candidatus Limnocylindrales bacterium]
MHKQIRTVPAHSPGDLAEFLRVLAEAEINIEIAGGSNVEFDGEFAFAVQHGQEEEAMRVLEQARYHPRLVEVVECLLSNEPGQLLACITEVAQYNAASGMAIRDISVGVPGEDGRIPVQVYSEARLSS